MHFVHKNSILSLSDGGGSDSFRTSSTRRGGGGGGSVSTSTLTTREPSTSPFTEEDSILEEIPSEDAAEATSYVLDHWNPFRDLSSWLDGAQGIELSEHGEPVVPPAAAANGGGGERSTDARNDTAVTTTQQQQPFLILGTAADDVSCHPHVLSPPLMESLLQFVPEYNGNDAAEQKGLNFWLKYSMVRDGASLWTLLRQVRGSTRSILAVETADGDGRVLGAFCAETWRLSRGWYGSTGAFLWNMRHGRLQRTLSPVQLACQESEIQVYPHRKGCSAIQYCGKDGLALGQGELLPADSKTGKHYGYGLYLSADLRTGTTSTSETFGNPCLVDDGARGATFEVANVEVWTLTTERTVQEAERSELSHLFLEGAGRESRLNLLNILVGGPI
jgi:hypothetical protein